jgi:hypothetical protein
MTPEQVAASYDQVAVRWLDVSTYGFAQIERASTCAVAGSLICCWGNSDR